MGWEQWEYEEMEVLVAVCSAELF